MYNELPMQRFCLDLESTDDALLLRNVELARSRGCSFTTLAAEPEQIERIYWLHQECRKRQPPVETRGEPQDYDRWQATFAGPQANPALYHVLVRGAEYIGVSCLVRAEQGGIYTCGFTGILTQYSRQRLALALKSHLLLAAKQIGIRTLVSDVRGDNPSMLALNRILGFA